MNRAAAVLTVLIVAGAAIGVVPAWAHHSFAATYNENQTITIEGDIVNFDYRNPHTFVTLNVTDPDGKTVLWAAEWRAPRMLESLGVAKDTLHAGDHVLISGSPGKDVDDRKIHLKTISRPSDGFKFVDPGRGRGGRNRFPR